MIQHGLNSLFTVHYQLWCNSIREGSKREGKAEWQTGMSDLNYRPMNSVSGALKREGAPCLYTT